jgi:protein TonB
MNRLEKKCLIATTGFHLLLVVILLVGPGFFTEKPKPDNTKVLDVIPSTAIDALFTSGVKDAKPPTPTPIVTPPPPQPVITPPPQPQVDPTPPPPEPKPAAPTFVEKVERIFKPEPVKETPDPIPEPKPAKATKPKPVTKPKRDIQVDLTKVTRTPQQDDAAQKAAADARKQRQEAQQQAQQREAAVALAMHNIKNNSSKATAVDAPGDSSVSYANYGQIVKSIYDQAWTPPEDIAGADENVRVRVTIRHDGKVISARVVTPSGDAKLDASVRRVLDRVQFIREFPDGSTDQERSYIINFNPKTKQLIG